MPQINPIYTEKTRCQDCYKCIRECPVKAIRVENGHAMVVSELCVLCGHCVTVCPAGAKRVREDLDRARQLLSLKKRVIVSLAPSFVSEFPGVPAAVLTAAMRSLGIFGVSETAIGADLVSAQLAEDFQKNATGETKLFLSSACPSAVEYIKRYMPEFSSYVTDRASPLLAHARYLKNRYGEDTGIIFIGPCVAKKREADVWSTVDAVISFQDLRRWFTDSGVRLDAGLSAVTDAEDEATDDGFIPFRAAKGALYPVDGGMIASVKRYGPKDRVRMMSVTGLAEIEQSLRGLDPARLSTPLFMELLACPGGCINGPLVSRSEPLVLKRLQLVEYAETGPDTLDESRPEMTGTIPVERPQTARCSDEQIRQALCQVGKNEPADELNCGSCGYDTCRAFARAMLEQRAEKTMCVSYMRTLAQRKANGLIRAIPSGVVITGPDLRIIECNENFARLMGEDVLGMYSAKPGMEGADLQKLTGMHRFFTDVMAPDGPDVVEHEFREGKKIFQATVFSIEKGESACGVIQDVTAPQIRRDRVIRQTRKVIDKNLAVVQKIAYLLGENAAEQEATLNSIIESFSGEDEGET